MRSIVDLGSMKFYRYERHSHLPPPSVSSSLSSSPLFPRSLHERQFRGTESVPSATAQERNKEAKPVILLVTLGVDVAWCCSRLARFVQQCCAWACALVRFSTRNMLQQGGQTLATCYTQECFDLLRLNVAIVWPELANAATTLLGYTVRWDVAIVWPGLYSFNTRLVAKATLGCVVSCILTVESGSDHDCRESCRIILTALDEAEPFPVSKWPERRRKTTTFNSLKY